MDIPHITPAEIRSFRTARDLTQAQLAQRIGGSTRAVEDWEAGRRQAPPMVRLAFAAIRRDMAPWSEPTAETRLESREAVSRAIEAHIDQTFADRAVRAWEGWSQETEDFPLAEAALLGFLMVANDGYNEIERRWSWEGLPSSGWQTSMVWRPDLGNGLHPTAGFECRHNEHVRRLAVIVDSKRPNERLPARLRVEQALVDANFRVMTFSGDEVLADAEGCADRISFILSDLIDETLIAAGKIQPRTGRVAQIG